MNAGTSDAEKNAQVPAGPPGALAVAVHTVLVVFLLQHRAKYCLHLLLGQLLLLLLRSRLVRHYLV